MALHTYLLITTVTVNGLNVLTKRQRVAEWIRKQDIHIYIYMASKRPISDGKIYQTKSKGIEKDISCKWKKKKTWGSSTYIQQNRL